MPETALHLGSGKVRELYALADDVLLLVASDRISTFDVVLPTPIPDKGLVLTGQQLVEPLLVGSVEREVLLHAAQDLELGVETGFHRALAQEGSRVPGTAAEVDDVAAPARRQVLQESPRRLGERVGHQAEPFPCQVGVTERI